MEYCTQAESSATGIGAINTMVFHEQDRLGYNTDYRAAMDCIEEVYDFKRDDRTSDAGHARPWSWAPAVLSRAIAWGLRQRKAEVIISVANASSGPRCWPRNSVAARSNGRSGTTRRSTCWSTAHPSGCIPMWTARPYNASKLNQYLVVFDTVYNPENTLLIKHAKRGAMSHRYRRRHVCSTRRLPVQVVYRQRRAGKTDAQYDQRSNESRQDSLATTSVSRSPLDLTDSTDQPAGSDDAGRHSDSPSLAQRCGGNSCVDEALCCAAFAFGTQ